MDCECPQYYGGIDIPSTTTVGGVVIPGVTPVDGTIVPGTTDLKQKYSSGLGFLSRPVVGGVTVGALVLAAVIGVVAWKLFLKKK